MGQAQESAVAPPSCWALQATSQTVNPHLPACAHQRRNPATSVVAVGFGGLTVEYPSASAANPPSLLSLIILNLFPQLCRLVSFRQCQTPPLSTFYVSKMPQSPEMSLFISHLEKTSKHNSSTEEQRQYRATIISALLKQAAILELSSSLFYPSHLSLIH